MKFGGYVNIIVIVNIVQFRCDTLHNKRDILLFLELAMIFV